MCCLCGVFSYFKAKPLEELIISTNDDLICRDFFMLQNACCNNGKKN